MRLSRMGAQIDNAGRWCFVPSNTKCVMPHDGRQGRVGHPIARRVRCAKGVADEGVVLVTLPHTSFFNRSPIEEPGGDRGGRVKGYLEHEE